MSFKIGVIFLNFAIFTENCVGVLKTCNFIKKRHRQRCFSVNIAKFLRRAFSTEYLWRLILSHQITVFLPHCAILLCDPFSWNMMFFLEPFITHTSNNFSITHWSFLFALGAWYLKFMIMNDFQFLTDNYFIFRVSFWKISQKLSVAALTLSAILLITSKYLTFEETWMSSDNKKQLLGMFWKKTVTKTFSKKSMTEFTSKLKGGLKPN